MSQTVEKRRLGRTGLDVTFLGFGALEIGRDWGMGDDAARRRCDEPEAAEVLNGVLDAGINLIDTASAYHQSEARIGRSIRNRRSEYVLATKCGEHSNEPHTYYDYSYKAIAESIEHSLDFLQTDCIDVLQIHWGPPEHDAVIWSETVRAMKDARERGKVRFLGASCPLHWMDRCIESGNFDVIQIDYNLLQRKAEPLIEKAAEKGIGILIRTGLAFGKLTPRVIPYLEQDQVLADQIRPILRLLDGDASKLTSVAFAFLAHNPAVTSVLAGTKSLAHVKANLAALQEPLDPQLLDEIIAMTAKF